MGIHLILCNTDSSRHLQAAKMKNTRAQAYDTLIESAAVQCSNELYRNRRHTMVSVASCNDSNCCWPAAPSVDSIRLPLLINTQESYASCHFSRDSESISYTASSICSQSFLHRL